MNQIGGSTNNMNIITIIKRWFGMEDQQPTTPSCVVFEDSRQMLEYIYKITQEVLNDK